HRPLGDAYTAMEQALMDLEDTSMFPVAQLTDHRDDIQPNLSMGQGPGSFFFCTIGHMIQRTLRVPTPAYHQSQADQSSERHQGALGMVGHPQALSTTHALLVQRCQAHYSLGRGTRFSSGHLLAP